MPRRARLVLEGTPLHIVQRGNNRERCFRREADYIHYLHWLRHYAVAAGCSIHAYVLMSNHVHLLASFADVAGPALLMKPLAQRYSQYFNWWYHRSGALWEGRYRSSLITDERYLLTCYRYIELNPVRAEMVQAPHDYRWSSYRGNTGLRNDSLLVPHELYDRLGVCKEQRQRAYRDLFLSEIDLATLETIRGAILANRPIGYKTCARGRPSKQKE